MINPIRIVVRNYQGIKDLDITIDGFTVLKGESEIGKSCLMRAIRAPFINQSGSSFIRHGTKEVYVMIHFLKQDFKIEWFKTKTTSKYILNDDPDNHTYEKLGRGVVPPPIRDFGMGELVTQMSNNKYYPQICSNQKETDFFLFEKDSDKAELLSEISKTTQVVKARRLVAKDMSSQKSTVKDQQARLAILDKKAEILDEHDVDAIKSETIKSVEDLLQRMEDCEKKQESLQKYRELESISKALDVKGRSVDVSSLEDKLSSVRSSISLLLRYSTLKELKSLLEDNLRDVELVRDLDFDVLKEKISLLKKYQTVKAVADVELPELTEVTQPEGLDRLRDKVARFLEYQKAKAKAELLDSVDQINPVDPTVLNSKLTDLKNKSDLYKQYVAKKNEILAYQKGMMDAQEALESIMNEISQYDNCPLCGSGLHQKEAHNG